MVKVVKRIEDVPMLVIKQIAAEINRLISEGANIINLSQGVPNLDIFDPAYDSIRSKLDTKQLPYTDVPGDLRVREIAAQFINKFYFGEINSVRSNFTSENIVLTSGACQAMYNVLALSIENKDDVVIAPLPAYGLYKFQTEFLGGTFQEIPTNHLSNFVPTVADLTKIFDQNTIVENGIRTLKIKSVILCYPNNPIGNMLTETQAREISHFLSGKLEEFSHTDGFSVILDEIYIGTFANPDAVYHSIIHYASPLLLDSIFISLSASKGLGAMPGMRAGFCFSANTTYTPYITKVQQACGANVSILSQEGLAASLEYVISDPSVLDSVGQHYAERTNFAFGKLTEISNKYFGGTEIVKIPEATFYLFVNFSQITQLATDDEIYIYFRDLYKNSPLKTGVAVIPGNAFGLDPTGKFIRISCAKLKQAMEILDGAIQHIVNTPK